MATELVTFPDPVNLAITYLTQRLPELSVSVPVVGEVDADDRPPTFVRVVRTGGYVQSKVVDRAMLTVEAWAGTDEQSAALASKVRAVVNAMDGAVVAGVQCYRVVEFSGPANSPDPVSRSPRHTWTVEVGVRGVAA